MAEWGYSCQILAWGKGIMLMSIMGKKPGCDISALGDVLEFHTNSMVISQNSRMILDMLMS